MIEESVIEESVIEESVIEESVIEEPVLEESVLEESVLSSSVRQTLSKYIAAVPSRALAYAWSKSSLPCQNTGPVDAIDDSIWTTNLPSCCRRLRFVRGE